ncbi:MAG: cytochrome c oxidase cbb3-type subunit [Candidatus Hydrogenedentes bacterium]|nr:cytochrome c oxidase cbb3-type subunit [Candidatus Hydrogenedentota bacterium]
MKMTPPLLVFGALMVFWASVFAMVIIPAMTMDRSPSDTWRAWTDKESAGHELYVANGCSYCHSQFIRVFDWDLGAERIAQHGDYAGQTPAILGTERVGPDLSQAGGEHPDDRHAAHFANPRLTRPQSLMPSWAFLGEGNIENLIAYVQAEGGTSADYRVARQLDWKDKALAAHEFGPDANVQWLHDQIPEAWRTMPNPYPATDAALARGKVVYQQFCVNCHGSMGDGNGSAAPHLNPKPLNFTTLRRHLVENKYIGGVFYYQIMNGITGTAMPYFKRELESEKIWDVSNYLAVMFLGYTDANREPRAIDASYEPLWENTFEPPAPQKDAP